MRQNINLRFFQNTKTMRKTRFLVRTLKNCQTSLNYLVLQAIASFFPLSGLKSQIDFCLQSYTEIQRILTKHSASQGEIRNIKLSLP